MGVNWNDISQEILEKNPNVVTIQETNEIYAYQKNGLYDPAEVNLRKKIQERLGDKASNHIVIETLDSLRRKTFIPEEWFVPPVEYIPIEGGVFDFQEWKLLDYDPKHFFRFFHPVTILPEDLKLDPVQITDNPIEKFLTQVVEKQEDALLLKEFVGYCFYRGMPFHNFLILVGAGGNGKSVFLNILRELLGPENVSGQSIQSLSENRFALADLYLKNANIFGDLSAKAIKDAGPLKMLTGEDMIYAEKKFKPSFSFKNYAKIVASCNEVPESPDSSDAFFRRSIIINFPNSFIGRENRNLTDELLTNENKARFFLSCISAFREALADNKWIVDESIAEKRLKYLSYSNSANAFLVETADYDPESEVPVTEIYKGYSDFCSRRRLVRKDERVFFVALYKFFNHKVYKRRITEPVTFLRSHVIAGFSWKLGVGIKNSEGVGE